MKRTTVQSILAVVVANLLLSMLVLSCGSGDGDDSDQTTAVPKFPPVVFIADKSVNGINELFAAFDDGTDIIKLSGPMTPGGNVTAFVVSPDGSENTKLSGTLVIGGEVASFDWVP